VYIIRPGVSTAVEIAACIFDGNTSELSGGAVYEGDVNLAITYVNSLFVNNEANGGSGEGDGALYSRGGANVSYVNCTFVGNMAEDGSGGGIFVHSGGDAVVTNGIFWDNCDGSTCATEDESAQIHLDSASATVTHTTLEGCADPGFCEDGDDANKAVEPTFAGTGLPHPYALTDVAANDALLDDGDGEDADNGCLSVNTTTVDLAGNDRFIRKDGVCTTAAAVVDIGAYEVQ
jgi:predicted outer membrane repeat protein